MMLADDPTAAAVLAAVPCYPVPVSGGSPAIDALRAARAGHGVILGQDGAMLILRRPWLELDVPLTPPLDGHVPYGSVGKPRCDLRCGLIPRALLDEIVEHFMDALPNEAAAFVIWYEDSHRFTLHFPAIDEATPSRLVYRVPVLPPEANLVADLHSHSNGPAFFSSTDDADDLHTTKIAIVVGRLSEENPPQVRSRLCAGGMFLPLGRNPFAEAVTDAD